MEDTCLPPAQGPPGETLCFPQHCSHTDHWGRGPGAAASPSLPPVDFLKFGSPLPMSSHVAQLVKNLPAMRETWVRSLGWEDPLEKGMATYSNILAWRIPWTV